MFHYGTDLYSPCAVHRALVSLGALYPSGTNGVLLLAPLPAILAYSRGGTRAFFSSRRFLRHQTTVAIFGIVSIIASSDLGVFYKTMLAHNSPRGVILGSAFCSVFKVLRPPHFSHVLGNYAGSVWPSGFGRTNCSDRKPMF